jgi:hypothetical protein
VLGGWPRPGRPPRAMLGAKPAGDWAGDGAGVRAAPRPHGFLAASGVRATPRIASASSSWAASARSAAARYSA